jgi:methionyl-tRNA formyltransferase
VRAQSEPYSGAFTFLDGKKVTVMRARPFPAPCIGTPGQIVRRLGDSTLVACGSSSGMIVDEIDIGHGVVAAGSFLNSVSVRLA